MQESPSTRRAWIEMIPDGDIIGGYGESPSTRRAWIEMIPDGDIIGGYGESPSTRRAWIEMGVNVDRKQQRRGRPPPGGRG